MDKMPKGHGKMDDMQGGKGGMGGMQSDAPPPPPPQQGGSMTPEDVRAQVDAALPTPDEGYSVKKIAKVAEAASKAMGALLPDQKLPPVVVPPNPDKGDRWMGKLPLEVMVPVLLLADLAVSAGGEAGSRYAVDPATLVDDGALSLLTATLGAMAKDKALVRALTEAPPAPDEESVEVEKAPPGEPPKAPPAAASYM